MKNYEYYCTSCDAIHEKEKQMTREEAERKIAQFAYNVKDDKLFTQSGVPPERQFLNTLQALGLIKFEEEKKRDVVQDAKNWLIDIRFDDITSYNVHRLNDLIEGLLKYIEEQPKIGDYVEISFDDETKRKIGILKGKRAWQVK